MAAAKKKMVIAAVVILAIGAGVTYWETRPTASADQVTIYGNVDIRQVQAAFDDNGRILRLGVQEGDRVHKDQLLAELDPVRFQDAVDRDQASMATQE